MTLRTTATAGLAALLVSASGAFAMDDKADDAMMKDGMKDGMAETAMKDDMKDGMKDGMAETAMKDDMKDGMKDAMKEGEAMMATTYVVTITNNLADELLAPVLVTGAKNDAEIFKGDYVTAEAEVQVLTGDPAKLAMRIGEDAAVGHGADGDKGVLLAAGNSISFEVTTSAHDLRVFSMVAPTKTTDHYVSAVISLDDHGMAEATLNRYDIGHDEGTMMRKEVSLAAATVSVKKK